MKRTYTLSGSDVTTKFIEDELPGYTLSKSVVFSSTRAGGQDIRFEADDDEIIELGFEDDTFWMGRAGELPKLFDKDNKNRGDDALVIAIPSFIQSNSTDRGLLRNIWLKALRLFKPASVVTEAIVKLSAKKVDAHIQPNPGLFYLDAHFKKTPVNKPLEATDKPYLLFIHGTATTANGSFDKMIEKQDGGLWNNLVKTYGNRILALEHYTLSVSPFENATEIVKWLPKNTTLHIITASRGGLVGEVLAKYHEGNTNIGFSEYGRALMEKAYGANTVLDFEENLKGKTIQLEKFIRVACPAAGTTLLSERLDLFLNVLINGINLIPAIAITGIMPVIKALLADVLACKAEPDVLPGLYAMNPKSHFIHVLNHHTESTSSLLHVIAGNNTFDLNPRGFITALTKLFFFKKNDWIVDTKSMSRGLFRNQNIGYFFDEGPEVDHFSYFLNTETQKAINLAIEAPANTLAINFESFDRTLDANKDRGWIMGNLRPKEISGNKPVLVLLPGILGSNLNKGNQEIYLNLGRIAMGGMTELSIDAQEVEATSLIGRFYQKFERHFSDEYDVAVFPYDWRKSIDAEAARLNSYLKELMSKAPGMPIKIVAHSMGGVVTRQFINNYKGDTWAKISANNQHKVLFLGSPLGGSFLIPEILIGKGTRLRQMVALDLRNDTESLLKIFAEYDGMLDILPITHTPYDFTKIETWQEMKQKSTAYKWPIPSDSALQKFKTFQESVLKFDSSVYKSNHFIYIAGKADHTANGFYYDTLSGLSDQLKFTATPFGDGSVTWESGIPKEIKENNRAYYVSASHGDLANDPSIFNGIRDILKTGKTNLLTQNPPASRGTQVSYDMPEEILEDQTQENLEAVLLGASTEIKELKSEVTPITIELKCGDLKYATYPLMVGHLKSDGIMSAEKIVDGYFGNALSRRLATGNYPGNIGESRYFINPNKKPLGAVVIGMGKTEKLSGYELEETIKQGFVDYLCSQKINGATSTVGISTLLLGTGYVGLSVETSVKAILSAAHKANDLIRIYGENTWPTIDIIELIEIYEDRALQALICLEGLKNPANLNFIFQPKLQKLSGSRKRLNFENMNDWWQRITIEQENELTKTGETTREASILFSASTGAAREEVRRLYCSKSIIESLVDEISNTKQWNDELAKTIFELLIPNDFKLAIRNQQNLTLIVDKYTAGYPWEMLQDVSIQKAPISATVGMIRQLATEEFRRTVNYTQENRVLIIGDPQTNGFQSSLPGAMQEAFAVDMVMEENGMERVSSFQDSSSTIIKKFFKSNYKIIHLAGHGIFDSNHPENSGMVIGNNVFLSVREIEQLSYVPEMVFINCCYLGKTNASSENLSFKRYKLAANLGTQLIQMGVKVVIAAGWAIDDTAALEFTKDFYRAMFKGSNFGDAIKIARKNCYENYPHTNTWGAYQCYGDPFYTLTKIGITKQQEAKKYYIVEQAEIDLKNLINRIEANYSEERKVGYINELNQIVHGIENANLNNTDLEELVATFYREIGEEKISLDLFEKLFENSANNFSVKSLQDYCALKIKYFQNQEDGVKEIRKAIDDLESIAKIRELSEIFNLIGDAYKALASKHSGKTRSSDMAKASTKYMNAYELSKTRNQSPSIYALANSICLNIANGEDVKPTDTEELERAYSQRKAEDERNPSPESAYYWLCKYVMHSESKAPKDELNKLTMRDVENAFKRIWVHAYTNDQKKNSIKNVKMLYNLFDTPKMKSLQKELNTLMEYLISLNAMGE